MVHLIFILRKTRINFVVASFLYWKKIKKKLFIDVSTKKKILKQGQNKLSYLQVAYSHNNGRRKTQFIRCCRHIYKLDKNEN